MFLVAIAAWLAWDAYQNGQNAALGGLVDLLSLPQYGEADAPTKSGDLADRMFETEDAAIPTPGEGEE
jgi:hypothetical protein